MRAFSGQPSLERVARADLRAAAWKKGRAALGWSVSGQDQRVPEPGKLGSARHCMVSAPARTDCCKHGAGVARS